MSRRDLKLFLAGGLLLAIALALFVSPFASSAPDGLNRVAIDQGFAEAEREHPLAESPLAGYEVEGVGSERLSTGLSGLIGVLVTFGAGMVLFGALRAVRARRTEGRAGP